MEYATKHLSVGPTERLFARRPSGRAQSDVQVRRRISPFRFPLVAGGLLAALFLAMASASVAQPTADLAARAQRAQAAMAAGRFDEAATIYSELVQAVPGEAGLHLNLGMALVMDGRSREALPHLQTAFDSGRPELFAAGLFLGGIYMELGQPDRALKPLETFLAAQPSNLEARQMLADTLLALERPEEALRQFRMLTERLPGSAPAWYGLGRSYEGVSQDAFEGLQTSDPESVEILLVVANMLVAEERDKAAFPLYREALEKRPGQAEVHEGLAGIYERDGHPDWAATERARAEALPAPDCASGPFSLECDFRAGQYSKVVAAAKALPTAEGRYWLSRAAGELAREAFVRLETLGPSPEATLVEVQILRSQRRYSESRAALEKAVGAWPNDIRIRRELATLLFIAREYEAARPLLEELLKHGADSPELNLLLGQVWVEQRQPEKGVPYLEKALAVDPSLLRARGGLGRAYLEAGDAAKAVPHLEAALETDDDGALRFQLARAYQATGRAEQAKQMRQEFQEIQRAHQALEQSEQDDLAITPP